MEVIFLHLIIYKVILVLNMNIVNKVNLTVFVVYLVYYLS